VLLKQIQRYLKKNWVFEDHTKGKGTCEEAGKARKKKLWRRGYLSGTSNAVFSSSKLGKGEGTAKFGGLSKDQGEDSEGEGEEKKRKRVKKEIKRIHSTRNKKRN